MARYFTIARPNNYVDKGRVVREFDQGFELQDETRTPDGKCTFVGTGLIFPFYQLKEYVIPLNLRDQFVLEGGKCYAKNPGIYHKNIFDAAGRAPPKEPEMKEE